MRACPNTSEGSAAEVKFLTRSKLAQAIYQAVFCQRTNQAGAGVVQGQRETDRTTTASLDGLGQVPAARMVESGLLEITGRWITTP